MASRTSPPRRIFVDSSVLIAAAISPRGSARELILRSIQGEFALNISSLVLEEVERNLSRKAPAALPAFAIFRPLLGSIVDPELSLVLRVAEIVELKDAPIVASAIKAEVDYLVSYDHKHLLRQRDQILSSFGIRIIQPDLVLRPDS